MQITKTTLRRIIKEELDAVLGESMQKMLGLPHQYTTQDLMRAVQGLIDSPQGDMTPGSSEARDVETLISNHIRDKGTPEEKDALKKLRDDFLKSIGSVYRGHMATGAHAGQTRYEKSRQRRAHFRDAMEEGVLDDIVGRKPSGAPMTAQARQDILDGYVAFVQDKMPNVSPEDAVKSAIDLFVAGGDPYLDPQSDLFDQDLLNSLMRGE